MSDSTILCRHTRANLFTRDECETILANTLGPNRKAELIEFLVEPELHTVGYLGEYFHLYIKYRIDNESTENSLRLFVKTMPYQNAGLSKFMEECGMLKKEASLYELLLDKLGKYSASIWCARCFYTRDDLFVLENIFDLGYAPLENSTGFLNSSETRCLLKSLAILHASSIAYEVKENVNIGEVMKHVLTEKTVSPTVGWFTAGLKAVIAVALEHPSYKLSHEFIKTDLPGIMDTVYDMVNPSKKYRNVFCHRDPWGGNVFYKSTKNVETSDNDIPAVLVDYQLCRYSPMAIDVIMALYLNLMPKYRKDHMEEYLNYYYDSFSTALNGLSIDPDNHITRIAFEESCKDLELFGVLYTAMSATILRVPDGYLSELKLNNPDDFYRYTNIDRTDAVLKLVRSDDKFRSYLFDCIEDLMQVVLK